MNNASRFCLRDIQKGLGAKLKPTLPLDFIFSSVHDTHVGKTYAHQPPITRQRDRSDSMMYCVYDPAHSWVAFPPNVTHKLSGTLGDVVVKLCDGCLPVAQVV